MATCLFIVVFFRLLLILASLCGCDRQCGNRNGNGCGIKCGFRNKLFRVIKRSQRKQAILPATNRQTFVVTISDMCLRCFVELKIQFSIWHFANRYPSHGKNRRDSHKNSRINNVDSIRASPITYYFCDYHRHACYLNSANRLNV